MSQLNVQQAFEAALERHRAGQLNEAEQLYRELLAKQPTHIEALSNLGNVLREMGKLHEAIAAYRQAIALDPSLPELHSNLGIALKQRGRLDEAIVAYRRAIALRPNYANALSNLGNALREKGQLDEAIAAYRQAVGFKPDFSVAHGNLGNALKDKGQLDEAIAAYRNAIVLRPDYAQGHRQLGSALIDTGEFDEAIDAFRQAISLKPGYAEAYANLGNALREKGRLDEALEACREAIALRPDQIDGYLNLGNVLKDKRELDEAIAVCRKTVALKPDYAEAHVNLALPLLLRGEYEEGWREYEWRLKVRSFKSPIRAFPQPIWDGGDLNGRRILLHPEQGFGDTIQFMRYVPLVAERGGRVLFHAPKELICLLRQLPGVEQWVASGEATPEFDVQCPLLSLPHLFGTTLETIPPQRQPWIADAELARAWRNRLEQEPPGIRVGLAWSGSPTQENNRNRSALLSQLGALSAVPGICFYSLQKGEAAKQTADPPAGMRIVDWTNDVHDFADTAALVANLDLIISVDTSVAHLAAAMGKPVWVLLAFTSDWRWLMEREDSPWYPTARLFRQSTHGDWPGVIARVVRELGAFHT